MRKGSGGIGFFVKNSLLKYFKMKILDDQYEGILWIQLRSIHDETIFNCCVCCIPPSDSSRILDLAEFYDNLMYQVHTYCKYKKFYICGDFNGRVGNLDDYIPGIDTLPECDVVNHHINKEGEHLCDFSIDTYCCILNGRNTH